MNNDAAQLFAMVRVSGLLPAAMVIALAWLAAHGLTLFVERLGRTFTDRRLALQQFGTLARFLIYTVAAVAALGFAFRFSKEMLLAVGGTVAVALGIAVKDIAAAVIAGLTVIIDRPFQVGDRIRFGEYYGEVKRIGLRSVRLVTLDDNLVTIPNNKFLTDVVASGNAGALDMLVQIDFFIAPDQDSDRAKDIVRDALTSSRYAYMRKPWSINLNQVLQGNYFALRLRAKAYVLDVQYEKAFESDVTERVLRAFRAEHIAAPAVLHRNVDAAAEVEPCGHVRPQGSHENCIS
ncbi:MAG: mechanosensitive ion channel family protein [Polyangiales bacterium]